MVTNEDETTGMALHERREEVMDVLTSYFASAQLDTDEFDRRLALAQRAETGDELEALLTDLGGSATGVVIRGDTAPANDAAFVPRPKRVLSILNAAKRQGTWYVPEYFKVISVMGEVLLDFREADLGAGLTEVEVTSVMGSVKVIVPPDLQVQCDGDGILGQFDSLERGTIDIDPDLPLLRITGVAVMAAVEIKVMSIDGAFLSTGGNVGQIGPSRGRRE